MTSIFNTDTKQTVELQVVSDGQDFLSDVIAGCENNGQWASEDMGEADWAMNSEEVDWWTRWAEREQRILDAANEIGEEAIEKLCELAGMFNDFETLQDEEEKYLGIA